MKSTLVTAERRKHPRAQLRLPARIRWRGPIGMRLETAETIDVSREGVLLACREDSHVAMSRVWIVFPFAAGANATMEPETPARIVRVESDPGGGCRVGLRLQTRHWDIRAADQPERRSFSRLFLCLPIFVRAADTPWPEETMTRDFSRSGVRFETSQVYAVGESVRAKVPWGEWARAGEISGRVVRVEPGECDAEAPGGSASKSLSCVAVRWTKTPRGMMRKPNG